MGYLHDIFSNHPHLSKIITTQTPEKKTHSTKEPRFKQNEDGTHSHHILWHPHKRLIGSFNGLFNHHNRRAFLLPLLGEKRGAVIDIKKEREKINKNLARIPSSSNLVKKWGSSHELIGKGSFGVVRLARKHSPDGPDKVYAIKEIKIRSDENTNDYVNRITSEFTISLKLHQRNVVETFDLLPVNENSSVYCQVMEYCNGGDLFNIIYDSSGEGLTAPEANCFFKQLLRGVDYLHTMGIAHRDLKPENLLLTESGCLKISDFGGSTDFVVKRGDKEMVRYCTGLCGSEPYIAPEEFVCYEYDARMVDIWSCAIIYMAMRTGTHLWQDAKAGDPNFDRYIKFRKLIEEERLKVKYERMTRRPSYTNLSAEEKSQAQELFELEKNANLIKARDTIRKKAQKDGLDVFQGLEMSAKKLLYRMLDPNPDKRITLDMIIENDWFVEISCCQEP